MPDKGAAMKRYARMLSAAGFILLAYSVLGQAMGYWRIWQWEQEFGSGYWSHWLGIGIGLAVILRLSVTSVLLRRLARPGPAGTSVRWLARFWIIPTLGVVGLSFWGYWELLSLRNYPAIFVSNPFGQSLQWAFAPCLVGLLARLCVAVLGAYQGAPGARPGPRCKGRTGSARAGAVLCTQGR